jgi:hypothetical protein
VVAVEPTPQSANVGKTTSWRLNYSALLFAQLVSSPTFASINPFLPLYLIDLFVGVLVANNRLNLAGRMPVARVHQALERREAVGAHPWCEIDPRYGAPTIIFWNIPAKTQCVKGPAYGHVLECADQ